MANILKVSQPLTGYEHGNLNRISPTRNENPSIQGQVLPEKVVKPDARSDAAAQEQNVGLKFQYESNYDNFLAQMRSATDTVETLSRFFFQRAGTYAEAGLSPEFAEKVAQFFEMTGLSESELLSFVKQQGDAGVRFRGAFFTLLQQVMQQSPSVELRAGILDFLKRYVDMAEGQHVMNNVRQTLQQLESNLFQNAKEQLSQMTSQLQMTVGPNAEGLSYNANILKQDILPFLNQYISKLHDRGEARELTTLLSSFTARLENGSGTRVQDAFTALMRFQTMQTAFAGFDTTKLLQVLANTDFERASKQGWTEKLVELVRSGMAGEDGVETKAMMKNLMQSIVLGESVYMPVLHTLLPVQVDGRLMFGEMWIDPDAGNGEKTSEEGGKTTQGLVKFDIQDLGLFDMFFVCKENNLRMQMNCPVELEEDLPKIQEDIAKILARNNLKTEELFVEVGQPSVPISEAFPKIFERRNSINVSI